MDTAFISYSPMGDELLKPFNIIALRGITPNIPISVYGLLTFVGEA